MPWLGLGYHRWWLNAWIRMGGVPDGVATPRVRDEWLPVHLITRVGTPGRYGTYDTGVWSWTLQLSDILHLLSNTELRTINEKLQTERIAADSMYTPSCLCIYISKLRYSKKCGNDNLLCLRRNGQSVEVSTQNQVKATVTEVCCHQVGHSMSNDI